MTLAQEPPTILCCSASYQQHASLVPSDSALYCSETSLSGAHQTLPD